MATYRNNQSIIMTGILFGLAAGIVGGVNGVTSAAMVGERGETVISYIALFIIAALACGSGVIAARISKRPATGLWVGLLVGVIASLIATTARVGYSIAFYDFVRHDPAEMRGWIHRGEDSFVSYLIDDRIGGFINMTLFFGCMCSVLGIVGGMMSNKRDKRLVH